MLNSLSLMVHFTRFVLPKWIFNIDLIVKNNPLTVIILVANFKAFYYKIGNNALCTTCYGTCRKREGMYNYIFTQIILVSGITVLFTMSTFCFSPPTAMQWLNIVKYCDEQFALLT